MRKIFGAIVLLALPLAVRADSQARIFYGIGATPGGDAVQHLGFSGDRFLFRGLTAGGEIGYMFPARDFLYGVGLLSVNGSYHGNHRGRLAPFATAGYTLGFRGDNAHLVNFGGGVTWWFAERLGLRAEFREYVSPRYNDWSSAQFHVALAIR
jgi:hypothetical protein